MSSARKRFGYLIAIVTSVLVLLLRLALHDVLGTQAHFLPFTLAVMASAWYGGFVPGILATVSSFSLGMYFVVAPRYAVALPSVADGLNAACFLIVGVTIS